jgi:hypothetical protein
VATEITHDDAKPHPPDRPPAVSTALTPGQGAADRAACGPAIAFGLAEVGVLRFSVRSQAITVSLATIPLVIGFYFADPSALVLAQLTGAAIALAIVRRDAPAKVALNLALLTLGSSLAIVVFRSLGTSLPDDPLDWWGVSFAATSVIALTGVVAMAVVSALSPGRAQPGALRLALLVGLVAAAVNTSLGLVGVAFLRTNPEYLWLVLAPALLAVLSYRAFAAQRDREERIEFLYDCARILARPPGASDPLVEMLSLARDKFRADAAEIMLQPSTAERRPTRTCVGPGSAVVVAAPIEEDEFAASMARLLPVDAGTRAGRPGRLRELADRLARQRNDDEITVPLRVDDEVGHADGLRSRAPSGDVRPRRRAPARDAGDAHGSRDPQLGPPRQPRRVARERHPARRCRRVLR